jgi:hypothetical protein
MPEAIADPFDWNLMLPRHQQRKLTNASQRGG